MKIYRTLFAFLLLIGASSASYADSLGSEIMLDCQVTPAISPSHIALGKFTTSNNLIRKTGQARRARGQYIRIYGQVVDEDCTPISNAVIKIWQADSAGKYQSEYALNSEWDVRDKSYDKYFAYNGITQTNNTGNFSFVTILPGLNKESTAPHINMSVQHEDFEEINTMMFFNKHPRNRIDKNLINIPKDKRELLIAKGQKLDPTDNLEGRIYKFTVTLPGINKYKGY